MKPVDLSTTDTALFFGVTSKTIAEWDKRGFPKKKRGVHPLKECFDWYRENITGNKDMAAAQARAKLRREEAKAEKDERENQIHAGKYVPIEKIGTDFSILCSNIRIQILSWCKRWPPLIANKGPTEISEILQPETHALLTELTNGVKEITKTAGKKKRA